MRSTPEDVQRAIADVEKALEIDPAYAEAWIFDANEHSGAQFFFPEKAVEHRARAEYAAREAVKLDPESGSAHAALGLALMMKTDWERWRSGQSEGAQCKRRARCVVLLPPQARGRRLRCCARCHRRGARLAAAEPRRPPVLDVHLRRAWRIGCGNGAV